MTDTTQTQGVLVTPATENIQSKKYSRLLIVAILASIICLLSVFGFAYYQYQSNLSINAVYLQKIEELNNEVTEQAKSQSKISQQSRSLTEKLNTQVQQLNLQLTDVQNKNKLFSADVQTLQRNMAETNVRHPSDWILAEVEYLINLSGRKLWLEHDVKSSIALLEVADLRLVEMGDPSLNPLRRALLEDINMLQALPKRDVDSVILALSGLERRIDKLVISNLVMPEATTEADFEVSTDVGDWKANIYKSWDDFVNSFIVISHRDTPVEALLSPEQSWYLKENLRNNLSKAEFAVYREQQDIYDLALSNAMQLIEFYYDLNDKNTEQFYTTIKKLSKQKVSIAYPDQFKSAPLLARVIKQRINKSIVIKAEE